MPKAEVVTTATLWLIMAAVALPHQPRSPPERALILSLPSCPCPNIVRPCQSRHCGSYRAVLVPLPLPRVSINTTAHQKKSRCILPKASVAVEVRLVAHTAVLLSSFCHFPRRNSITRPDTARPEAFLCARASRVLSFIWPQKASGLPT